MIVLTRVTFALLLSLLLAACGSTPQSKYYRLSASGTGGEGGSPSLGIGPIVIPEYLDRNSMVFVTGDNQLHIASYERWAEPLPHGITRVLGLNLSEALDTQDIRPFPWPASDRPAYAVQVWLLELDAGDQQTTLVAEWRLREPGSDREIARRIGRYQAGASNRDGAAVAAAYSHLLRQLTDDIASALREDMAARENGES